MDWTIERQRADALWAVLLPPEGIDVDAVALTEQRRPAQQLRGSKEESRQELQGEVTRHCKEADRTVQLRSGHAAAKRSSTSTSPHCSSSAAS